MESLSLSSTNGKKRKMVKIKYQKLIKNRAVYRADIRSYINKGYSTNRIQKEFMKRKMGIRRQVLLSEIRAVKKIPIKRERMKYIPKKYRVKKLQMRKMVYRVSFAVRTDFEGVPFHKRYLGFLLQAFHVNNEFLRLKIRELKDKLIKLTTEYLRYSKSEWWFNFSIGTEYPTEISDTIFSLSGTWLFQVEEDGAIIHSETGVL